MARQMFDEASWRWERQGTRNWWATCWATCYQWVAMMVLVLLLRRRAIVEDWCTC